MRAAARLPLRPAARIRPSSSRRFLSVTPPAHRSRTWTSSAVRWGIAIGGVYWYATTNAFDAYAESSYQQDHDKDSHNESSQPTLDDIASARRQRKLAEPTLSAVAAVEPEAAPSSAATSGSPGGAPAPDGASQVDEASQEGGGGLGGLEEEAQSEGAFNEETGEINWDCPCLGGMAYGPCGPEFREAFSCFVFSQEDPKGIDCIDRFKNMQDCFRRHPEDYGAELADDIDDDDYEATQNATRDAPSDPTSDGPASSSQEPPESSNQQSSKARVSENQPSNASSEAQQQQPPVDADKELPKP